MVKRGCILLTVLVSLLAFGGLAEAFVVQKPGKALTFRNIARETGFPKKPKAAADKPAVDSVVDYEEIADKLLISGEPEKIFINLSRDTAKNIAASPGQTFFVVLPEEEGSSWHLDPQTRLVEIVSSEHDGKKRILELRVLCCGESTIFLDNLVSAPGTRKVVQSRILRLRVNEK